MRHCHSSPLHEGRSSPAPFLCNCLGPTQNPPGGSPASGITRMNSNLSNTVQAWIIFQLHQIYLSSLLVRKMCVSSGIWNMNYEVKGEREKEGRFNLYFLLLPEVCNLWEWASCQLCVLTPRRLLLTLPEFVCERQKLIWRNREMLGTCLLQHAASAIQPLNLGLQQL